MIPNGMVRYGGVAAGSDKKQNGFGSQRPRNIIYTTEFHLTKKVVVIWHTEILYLNTLFQ